MARSDRVRLTLRRGATLIEVLVGCGVFAFLMISSIAIMNIGTGGMRGVESKADVTRQLNKFEADITTELKRASLDSVGVYTPTSDYRWALWFKTPMNEPGKYDLTTGAPTGLGNSLIPVSNDSGKLVAQRYVLYYVTRMSAAKHTADYGFLCASYSNGNSGPDTICPHKWLVKKELWLKKNQLAGPDTIGSQSDPTSLTNLHSPLLLWDNEVTQPALLAECESFSASSVVHRAQVVAENVLSFEVTRLAVDSTNPMGAPKVSATGPIVLFDLKVFRALQARKAMTVGVAPATSVTFSTVESQSGNQMVDVASVTDATGTVTTHTNSSFISGSAASSFTVQLDNRVIVQNP
ncbi:MAG: hypothetical protein EB084_20650 [Proteobacteria bacterium]|nr:hypothetical protein [Pseudomonadota bacterium]